MRAAAAIGQPRVAAIGSAQAAEIDGYSRLPIPDMFDWPGLRGQGRGRPWRGAIGRATLEGGGGGAGDVRRNWLATCVATWSLGELGVLSWAPAGVEARQTPSLIDPSLVEKRLEAAPGPLSTFEGVAPEVESGEAAEIDDSVIFTLTKVSVEGVTVYGAGAFRPLCESRLGSEVSFGDMLALARAITMNYRNAGYILSRAFIPVI